MLNRLTLEELVALKLELSTKTANTPLYNMPIRKNIHHIVNYACIWFAISSTFTMEEAAAMLGMQQFNFFNMLKKYGFIKIIRQMQELQKDYEHINFESD
jgi:hypothetical protein